MIACNPSPYKWRNAYGPIPVVGLSLLSAAVIDAVSQDYGINDLLTNTKTRKREYSEARQISMYLIKKYNNGIPMGKIGKLFKKDRTTVIYAIETVNDLIDTLPAFRDRVYTINQTLNIHNDAQIHNTASRGL
jgi:hypothetical protein